jgi:hypothetical protein
MHSLEQRISKSMIYLDIKIFSRRMEGGFRCRDREN